MAPDRRDLVALRRLASARGSVFTIADATGCGWSPGRIRYELSSQAWCRLRRGVFVDAVVVERAGSSRLEHRTGRRGVRTTTPARTVVDIARAGDVLDAVVVVDSGMRRLGVRRGDVAAVLQACAGWPGTAAAATALELADPVSQSVFESVSRVELTRRGLRPETQVWLAGPTGPALRVDFLWWLQRTVGEADGLGKYAKYGPGNRLDPLQSEKLRQEVLEEWGLEVVRWGWREMREEPDAVARRVGRGYARSAVRQEMQRRAGARTPASGRPGTCRTSTQICRLTGPEAEVPTRPPGCTHCDQGRGRAHQRGDRGRGRAHHGGGRPRDRSHRAYQRGGRPRTAATVAPGDANQRLRPLTCRAVRLQGLRHDSPLGEAAQQRSGTGSSNPRSITGHRPDARAVA